NGEELWNSTLPVEWGLSYPFRGPVWYVASTAVVDDASGVTTVTAFDTRTWSIAWTTTVDHCSNSNVHYPMGYWTTYEGIVDGKGDIYCPFYRLDSNEPRLLSVLSPDGSVISRSTVRGEILGAFRSGGLLTYYWPDHDLLALDSHGGQQWKYDVGNATTYYGMMLGNNDGIYLSNFTHIFALARSPGTDIGMFVASILVIDISVVAAMFWTRRNRLKT
ncbi:MAG: hypothetical protein LUO79_01235, partial [Methanomassiliicoccales archaeon]|nr:hypothetical protein [Methanomassiliicoccales archaeon]